MARIILVTGGARSGKSSFAEQLAKELGEDILYIATSMVFDEEMRERVKKHRLQRPSHWETMECYKDFEASLPMALEGKNGAMLDCLTIMTTNIMFEQQADFDNVTTDDAALMEKAVRNEVTKLLESIENIDTTFIFVTNEVGMGIVPDNPISRVFRDIAGRMNQLVASKADEAYLCVSGIPVKIK